MASWFDKIDREDGLRAVLDHLGVRYNSGKLGWQKVHCPNKAAHPQGDRNPSCSVNLGIGRVKCHSCELRGDWAGVMYQIEGVKVDEAVTLLDLSEGENFGTTEGTGSSGSPYIF